MAVFLDANFINRYTGGMKLFWAPLVLLTLTLADAQSDPATSTSNAAPPAAAPAKRAPTAASSMPVKIPPNAPDTRGPGWEKRALALIAKGQAEAGTTELIFDGDSITDFWQTRGLSVWTARFSKYHPIDFGISGDFTQSVLWRLAHGQAEGMHPKLIALLIGTNNMRFTSTPQDIADGVAEIIRQYQKRCPDAVILLQAIFPRAALPTDPYRLKVEATNALLAKLGDGSKVIYLDFGDKFLSPDGTLGRDVFPDLLHPSVKGYQIWADAIQPTLDKYFPTP
jgi:lysophospholipase L1-like esterase